MSTTPQPHCATCVCGKRAPVQGDYPSYEYAGLREKLGREPKGPGTISWAEHEEAWSEYARRYGNQQSAERMAERGGFGYGELLMFLRREPTSWRPAGRGDLWDKAADEGAAR